MAVIPVAANCVSDDEDGDWSDWQPVEQTAIDLLKAAEAASRATEEPSDDSDDDSDDWNPCVQRAADAEDDQDEDSEDEWVPQAQGAADVKESEKEALKNLLTPAKRVDEGPTKFESKKEADAAGRMLHDMKRPPTIAEAKAEIPRGPDVDVDNLPAPEYREMSQEEAVGMVGRGASVDYHGQHGKTPLHKACECAYPLLVKAICDAGGDPDIRDNYGETPLLAMAHTGQGNESIPKARRSETIQMMLSCGADVHAVNPRGRTCLHLAVTENDHQAIETFIEGMADVNAQDLAGFSPLMWAAGRNGASSVKMLLDYDADMNLKAARGQTAMTFALTNGCSAIIDILEKHQMILDAEEAKAIKERGERGEEQLDESLDEALQLPRPEWACRREKPAEVEPYVGRRVYAQAKPDRHSNVY